MFQDIKIDSISLDGDAILVKLSYSDLPGGTRRPLAEIKTPLAVINYLISKYLSKI